MIFVTAAAAGLLSRAMRASVQAAQSRADRAEAELDRQSSQAAERERIRIARELHDVVAHHVSLIAVQAEAAASLLPGRPDQARRSVEVIGDTARQALTELRRLLGVLRRPSARPETTPSASLGELGEVLDQVRGAGLPVDFEVTGTPVPLAPGVDLTAYRIVQEALTNTIRHANAARAAVRLCYEPGYITVSVTDSGRPSPAAGNGTGTVASGPLAVHGTGPLLTGAGLGLAGIAERVASCGGHLTVGPIPGTAGGRLRRDRTAAVAMTSRRTARRCHGVRPDPGAGGRRPGTGPLGVLRHPGDRRRHRGGGGGRQRRGGAGRGARPPPRRGADGHPHAGHGRARGHPPAHPRRRAG